MFAQIRPISLILTAVPSLAIFSRTIPAFAEPPTPCLTLKASKKSYPLGAAVTMQYALRGADKIPVKPIPFCPVGEGDFSLEFIIRDASGATLPGRPCPYVGISGHLLNAEYWRKNNRPSEAVLNEWIPIYRSGVYVVTARLTVLRPAGKVTTLFSAPVTLRVTDGPQEREIRQARIRHAARLLAPSKTWSGDERQAAVESLRFVYDAEALPALITALGDRDMGVYETAEMALSLWPDPVAVTQATERRLKILAAQGGGISALKWADILSLMELRQRFGPRLADGDSYYTSRKRAQQAVRRTLFNGLPALSPGAAGERRMEILLLDDVTPTAETLRPILRAASQMNADGQERLTFVLGQWEKRHAPSVLRPLKRDLEQLAKAPAASASLRQMSQTLLTHGNWENAPFLQGAADEKHKSLFIPGNRL